MKKFRIVLFILIVIWMIIVFSFSNENAEQSTQTSSKVTEEVVEVLNKGITEEEKVQKVKEYQPKIRKIAHVTLYTIGGILAFAYANTYNITIIKKVMYAIIFCAIYAITDEFHQSLVPRQRTRIYRCNNRYITGQYCGTIITAIIIKVFRKKETK